MCGKYLWYILCLVIVSSCSLFNKGKKNAQNTTFNLDTVNISASKEPPVYRASETRMYDIINTKLEVKFDWTKSQLAGKATITLKPYFYSTDKIELNAKGFDINEVALLEKSEKNKLEYNYDKKILSIHLNKQYTKNDTLIIYVDYIAKPEDLVKGGSEAIQSDKGLFFINADGKDTAKSQQIWTQGETEANSAWFPTSDHPNERMTDEIYMTVDKKYITLSNGELVSQTLNADGTHTDYWKMSLPHAPYLVMMAVGDFAVVKDKWRSKEVNYYVEKKYEPYAKAIFGNTPEMMEFFSNKLGVAFPWNKYSQIVVRDYVSGAMENTTATIHGEFLQRNDRELVDENYEDVVSHELFHQWFGDLVTCESWSNLPLNESFATYGEYLWREYKYGREEADLHIQDDLKRYLSEAASKQVNMIRYYYEDREEMFDDHTYQKGGRILHMLRKYVGDEAFFESLKLYLEKNKFSPVEIHNLRLAFEQVTGEDLNWFFDQWFFASGHPMLSIKSTYDEASKKVKLTVKQLQNIKKAPLYKLPVFVDIYGSGKTDRHKITITKKEEEFLFDAAAKPDLVNFDAEKMLLCVKEEHKTIKELAFQYNNAPLYLDRYEAIVQLNDSIKNSLAKATTIKALNDKTWKIRWLTILLLDTLKDNSIKQKLMAMATTDEKSAVRATAIESLSKNFSGDDLKGIYKTGSNDRSYRVVGESMSAMIKADSVEALKLAQQFENETNLHLLTNVAKIYSQKGTNENNKFFINACNKLKGYEKTSILSYYGTFLQRCNDDTINKGVAFLKGIASDTTNEKWHIYYARKSMDDLINMYEIKEEAKNKAIQKAKSAKNDTLKAKQEEELAQIKNQKKKIKEIFDATKKK